jgi:actin-binding LIM protein
MTSPNRCSTCKLPLTGQYVTAASRAYHPSCFACSKCRKPISGSFVTSSSQIICVSCSTASAPTCSGCGGKITEGGFVTVKGLSFHPQHFACTACGAALQSGLGSPSSGVFVFESFGTKPRAMCGSCHAAATGRICFGCSKPIVGKHLVADNKLYAETSPQCFSSLNHLAQVPRPVLGMCWM